MPTEIGLAAYNEAGHCIVGRFQGRAITAIYNTDQAWQTWDDSMNMISARSDVELHFPYTKLGYQPPRPGWLPSKEEECAFKFAGVVAEKLFCEQLSIDSNEVRLGVRDILEAEAYARQRYPNNPQAQQAMLRDAEVEARKILSEPSCWRAVEQLAKAFADMLVQQPRFEGEHVHEIITQALIQNTNEPMTT